MIVAYLCVCKFKETYDLRYKSNKFQYILYFWEWVLIKTYIQEMYLFLLGHCNSLLEIGINTK